jgi:hypothetical protein
MTGQLTFSVPGAKDRSPDCRWLYGEVPYYIPNPNYDDAMIDDTYRERRSDYVVFWDASTGAIIRSFYHPYRAETYSKVSWSPDANYAIVQTTEGAYLYNLISNSATLLLFNSRDDALRSYFQLLGLRARICLTRRLERHLCSICEPARS